MGTRLAHYARHLGFFLCVIMPAADYYADGLLLEGWETVSGVLKLPVKDVFSYGVKATIYAKRREKAMKK